jgi:competence protein ComEC
MTLLYLSIAWIAGVYTGSITILPLWTLASGFIPLLFIPVINKYKSILVLFCFCLFAFASGNFCFQPSLPKMDQQHLQFYNDQGKFEIEGRVITEPEHGDRTSTFQLSADKITMANRANNISGKAMVRVSRYSAYHYGDILKINCKLETPPKFNDFDYKDYLARQGIYSLINYPKIEIMERNTGFQALSVIYSLRNSLSQSISRSLPEPQCSLAQGMLLGLRGNIPDSLTQAFANTGTTHILAISGLNLSIIIGILLSIGVWFFGKRYSIAIWIALVAIWLYAIITGMKPPIIRGAIMGSMFLFAEVLGRQRNASTALVFAAAIMVGIEPQILWNVSFQLSFLSMAGLVYIFPYFQDWARKGILNSLPQKDTVNSLYHIALDGLGITAAAILATLPIIAYHFGTISLMALPANFFAIPSLPPIIITTALVGVTGLLLPVLAQVMGWIAWLFLSYFILIVQIFNALPFSVIKLSNISIWHICSYYVLLVLAIVILAHRSQFINILASATSTISKNISRVSRAISLPLKKWSLISVLFAVILTWAAAFNLPDDKLHVHILNIGQGDAILIQTPSHQNILIDGGPSPQAINLELGKKLPFWDRTIDLMILTQPQSDHLTGLIEVLNYYKVKQVIAPEIPYDSFIYDQWLNVVQANQVNYSAAHSLQEINLGNNLFLEILHPPAALLKGTYDDINNNGLVLRLSYQDISFLFTADIDEEAEWYLISRRAELQSTVLKIAHHGSLSSTSAEFLAVANPSIAVISVSSNNNFNHPHPEIMSRLNQKLGDSRLFLTSKHGTVELITDGNKLWVKTEH